METKDKTESLESFLARGGQIKYGDTQKHKPQRNSRYKLDDLGRDRTDEDGQTFRLSKGR